MNSLRTRPAEIGGKVFVGPVVIVFEDYPCEAVARRISYRSGRGASPASFEFGGMRRCRSFCFCRPRRDLGHLGGSTPAINCRAIVCRTCRDCSARKHGPLPRGCGFYDRSVSGNHEVFGQGKDSNSNFSRLFSAYLCVLCASAPLRFKPPCH